MKTAAGLRTAAGGRHPAADFFPETPGRPGSPSASYSRSLPALSHPEHETATGESGQGAIRSADEGAGWRQRARGLSPRVRGHPHVITVVGNHDTVLGQTAGITIQQRYRNTEEVVCHELERRLEPATCEPCCQSTRVKRC